MLILLIIFSIPINVTALTFTSTNINEKITKLHENSKQDIDYVNIVKAFLQTNSRIITPNNTKEGDNVLLKDLDNDGINEIITAYKSDGNDEKINIIVLKKVGENWTKVLDEPGEGYSSFNCPLISNHQNSLESKSYKIIIIK